MKKIIVLLLAAVMLAGILAGCGDTALKSYQYRVVDENGKGVEGAALQICTDESCQMFKTDANGYISCPKLPAAVYEVHILSAPAGYTYDKDAVYTTPAQFEAHDFVVQTAK